jgi:Fe-S oxidoreductase
LAEGLTRKREKLTDYRDDYWSCGKCKMCQSVNVQKVESARFSANCPTGTRHRFESYYAAGMMEIARALTNYEFEPTDKTAEIIYSCNLCGLCQEMCFPLKGLHTTRIIQLLREKAVDEGWGPLPGHEPALESIGAKDNPFGLETGFKGEAAVESGLAELSKEGADSLLFIGCSYASPGMRERLAAAGRVLGAAGVEFQVLGDDEPCCRSLSLSLGDRDSFEENAPANAEKLVGSAAKRLICLCPHCLQVFNDEYADRLEMEVVHVSEVLANALAGGGLEPEKEISLSAAYHDPCMLGRWREVYEPPRECLSALPGLELIEMDRGRENSWCCGYGGGVAFAFGELAAWTAAERRAEAGSTGAEAIVTACPHCEAQLAEGGEQRVLDLCELIDMSL